MGHTIQEVIEVMESIAPIGMAEDWDNVGLLVGNREAVVHKIMVALDITHAVIAEAITQQVDLIIVHHPVLFKPIQKVTTDSVEGEYIYSLIQSGIALYAAHTNWDAAAGGVDDILSALLGIRDIRPLISQGQEGSICSMGTGIGRIGTLSSKIPLRTYIQDIKRKIEVDHLDIIGNYDRKIHRVACCAGAGGDFIATAASSGADLYITGEVKYHDALSFKVDSMTVAVLGHFASELPAMAELIKRLQKSFNDLQYIIEVIPSINQRNPFCRLKE